MKSLRRFLFWEKGAVLNMPEEKWTNWSKIQWVKSMKYFQTIESNTTLRNFHTLESKEQNEWLKIQMIFNSNTLIKKILLNIKSDQLI